MKACLKKLSISIYTNTMKNSVNKFLNKYRRDEMIRERQIFKNWLKQEFLGWPIFVQRWASWKRFTAVHESWTNLYYERVAIEWKSLFATKDIRQEEYKLSSPVIKCWTGYLTLIENHQIANRLNKMHS